MDWSDEKFRERVQIRAGELALSLSELLDKAEVSREVFYKTPSTGRRIDTIAKIGAACGWPLAEAMGFGEDLSIQKMLDAYKGAQRVIAMLPERVRSEAALIEAMCYLYEEMRAYELAGQTASEILMTACERTLVRAFSQRNQAPAAGPENTNSKRGRRRSPNPATS